MSGTQVQNVNLAAFSTDNQAMPPARIGPKDLPISLDFSTQTSYFIDLQYQVGRLVIDAVQSIYIDNADNADPVTMVCVVTGQRIIAPPRSQGIYAVLVSTPPQFMFSSAGGVKVNLHMLNVPMPTTVWNAGTGASLIVSDVALDSTVVSGAIQTREQGATYVDNSITTVGGAGSHILVPADPARNSLIIQGSCTAGGVFEDTWISLSSPATVGFEILIPSASPLLHLDGQAIRNEIFYHCTTSGNTIVCWTA